MPPRLVFDISGIDLNQVTADQEEIRRYNPQRGDMEQLNRIIWADPASGRILGLREISDKEFWVPGHIPGRPLFPGVLMIEAAAQVASFYTRRYMGWEGFIGFGGVTECKFRSAVVPPARMLLLGQKMWERHGRVHCQVQGLVEGQIAFEVGVTGTQF
jgi:3-hydroxyacyl-[acyl-carrier-protein] dehydratase